jgi:hypothetical protein
MSLLSLTRLVWSTDLKVSLSLKKSRDSAVLSPNWSKTMQVPNWQKHSKKEQKRHLKPQALRQAKSRRQALKKRLNKRDASFFINI